MFQFYTETFDYIFSLFPDYYKEEDSYKNLDGEGLLERYCRNFDQELEDIRPFIGEIQNLFSAIEGNPKYLTFMAGNVGHIPLTGILENDKNLVAWAITLYKLKGTASGFKLIFNIFNCSIVLTENLTTYGCNYDAEFPVVIVYDDEDNALYDSDCPICTTYDIQYQYNSDPGLILDDDTLNILRSLCCLVQPIDTRLGTLSRVPGTAIVMLGIGETYPYAMGRMALTDTVRGISIEDMVTTYIIDDIGEEEILMLLELNTTFNSANDMHGYWYTEIVGGERWLYYINHIPTNEHFEATAGTILSYAYYFEVVTERTSSGDPLQCACYATPYDSGGSFALICDGGTTNFLADNGTDITWVLPNSTATFTLRAFHNNSNSSTLDVGMILFSTNPYDGDNTPIINIPAGSSATHKVFPKYTTNLVIGNYDQANMGPVCPTLSQLEECQLSEISQLNVIDMSIETGLGDIIPHSIDWLGKFDSLLNIQVRTSAANSGELDNLLTTIRSLMGATLSPGGQLDIRGPGFGPGAPGMVIVNEYIAAGWTVLHD